MNRNRLLIVFVLTICSAWALAQMGRGTPPTGAPQTQPGSGMGQQPGIPGMGNEYPQVDQRGAQDRDRGRQQTANVDDATLERQVHEQLATRGEFANVQVSVKNGVVRLDGSVPRKEDRREARHIAESVPGVRGVREKLSISPSSGAAASSTTGAENTSGVPGGTSGIAAQSSPSGSTSGSTNADMTSSSSQTPSSSAPSGSMNTGSTSAANTAVAIQNDLRNDTTLVSNNVVNNINVNVTENSIVLSGSVPTQQDAQRVLSVARSHAGPRSVVNNLVVTSAAGSSATASTGATGAVSNQPSGATAAQSGSMNAQTGSASGQSGAAGQTGGAAGTTGSIGAPSGAAQGQAGGTTTEQSGTVDLAGQIQTALKNEPTLANDNIMVNVTDDVITLTGTAASGKDKQTARRIAESYAANRRVVDHITVGGRSSEEPKGQQNPSSNIPPK